LLVPALVAWLSLMHKDENDFHGKKTPIEQMFHKIFGREMTTNERHVLLTIAKKKKKTRKT
jgi:hypothetical protein